jgi:exopolysaccharide production protein ExoZ
MRDRLAAAARARTAHGKIPPIVSIQYLRAVAALAVVAFHALEATPTRFPVGAAGVDVFFVISGFIMWTLTESAEAAPASFLWRRFIRVTPPYWVATLLVAAIALLRPHFLWMPPVTWDRLAKSLLFIPHLDAWGQPHPVVTQGWTLNYEMFFYAVFGAVLFAPRRLQLPLLSGAFLGLIAAGLAARPDGAAAATYTSLLLAEFLAGAWLGRLWLTGRLRSGVGGALLVAAGLATFALEQWLGVGEEPLRALFWGLPALMVVTGALCLEGAGYVKLWRVPKALGDGSYSIYLFHVIIVALGYRLLDGAPTAVRLVGTLAAAAVAGVALFHLVEKPLTAGLRRLAGRRAIARPASVAALRTEA